MKFTNGNWLIKEGVKAHYAAEAYDVKKGTDSLTVYCPVERIKHRGQTLGGPLLTIKYFSPTKDVIGVNVTHFKGKVNKGPEFELSKEDISINLEDNKDFSRLESGKLSVEINKNDPYIIEYKVDEKVITKTGSSFRKTAYMETNSGPYMVDHLHLGVGENVYGLGERFTSFVKNGQVVDIWNKDGGTSSEQAYKNIPFYITNKGYGVFINNPGKVSFEIASEISDRVQFSVPGESLEYYVIYGPTPKEILEKYTKLTGRAPMPPAWSFGLWLTTSFTTNYDEKTVTGFIEGMEERELPLSVFHFDCFWMREFNWCDFKWDKRVFPDPEGMIKRLKERGLKICVWINPYIGQRSELFEEGMDKGYLLKKKNGDVWQWDLWQPGMGIVDFTNPEACKWYSDKLEALLDMGVDCFKTDFGERIPLDVEYYDGSDPELMHNYYTYIYNKVVFDLLERKKGKNEAVLFARSATTGGQKFPVHWGGDCSATYESMAESLRGGLSLGLSGFSFWSHDIGGFESQSSPDIYKRWIAFGLLSSHSRLHGSSSYRVPWNYDEESVGVLRFFTNLKCSLMPYIYSQATESTQKGLPVMRSMMIEYPQDRTCDYLDRQYMLGEDMLVAPILSEDGNVEYYLPRGLWTNFITGETKQGGEWIKENHDYLSIPLMVPENTVIPVGKDKTRPDYDYFDDITFHLFNIQENQEVTKKIYSSDNKNVLEVTVKKYDGEYDIMISEKIEKWNVLLRGVNNIESVNGGEKQETDKGILIVAKENTNKIEIVGG